jgi:hypothetical protein
MSDIEEIQYSSYGSSSSQDYGSVQRVGVSIQNIFDSVTDGRNEHHENTEKVLTAIADAVVVVGRDKAAPQIAEILKTIKEGQEEQKRQHDKLLRAIWRAILVVGCVLGVLMLVCTVMLYTKPCACASVVNHTTCAPVVNCTKYAPVVNRIKCAPPVNYTKCAPPVNRTKCVWTVNNNKLNIIVHVHVNTTSTIDTPENKCSIDNKHNMTNAQQKMILGAVITGPSLVAIIGTAVATALGY